jgi:WD40 repeat protein
MTLQSGTRLGTYEILGPLGAGGMGEVYRARDSRLERDVAIKALPEGFAQDAERLARFEREARLLASLNHPNVAGIHGIEEVEGHRYLVLEFVTGETLSARLARGALAVDEALEVCRQVAAGVEAAHEAGIVHRDLKPGNVMLKDDGSVKVLDFGLARSGPGGGASSSDPNLSASPTMTSAATTAGVILGTAAYMSPEQARGRAVDKRSDIWSFGCVLYECLTARQAFHGETVSDAIAAILKTEADLGALPAGTPARVRELLARCLCKDPRERLRDIGEARVLLATVRADDGAVAAPIPASRRSVPLWLAAGTTLVVAALAVVTALRVSHGAARPVRMLDVVAEGIETAWFAAPVISPDGGTIAYLANDRLWVRDLKQLEPHAVADIEDATPICWSPDARELAFGDRKKLWKVPVAGGVPVALCDVAGTGRVFGIAWSTRGNVAFSVYRGGMYSVAAAGGTASLLFDIDPQTIVDFHSPSWLANGDLMYTVHRTAQGDTASSAQSELEVYAAGRHIPISTALMGRNGQPIVTASGKLLYLRRDANAGIWAVGYDVRRRVTTGEPRLVAAGATSVSASNDGSLLYVKGSGVGAPAELVWVDRSGKFLESTGPAHPGLLGPALSPDGRRVAFGAVHDDHSDVWVRDLARGVDTRITFSKLAASRPQWLGRDRLSYLDFLPGERSQIMAVKSDGSGGPSALAPPSAGNRQGVQVAADGRTALRLIDEGGHGRIRVSPVLADGSLGAPASFLRFTPDPDVDEASLAPNGQLLAYATSDPGTPRVFVTRFPSGAGQWQVSSEDARQPRWAPGSGALYYVAGSGSTRRTLVEVKIDPSQDPPVGRSTRLFDLGPEWSRTTAEMSYVVGADGQRFLVTREASGTSARPGRMVLVQNWESEFSKQQGR